MNSILIPTDFSAHAANAFDYACQLALFAKCKHITLLHSYTLGESTDKTAKELAKTKKERLKKIVANYKFYDNKPDVTSIQFDYIVQQGNTVDVIEQIAASSDYDLLVMGTKGANNTQKWVW